ncbi:MAG: LuxR C-terminal-related transcriptional regulator [Angustibacter sp.]
MAAAASGPQHELTVAGSGMVTQLSAQARLLYRALSQRGTVSVAEFERVSGGPVEKSTALAELAQAGLVRQGRSGIVAIPRRQAIDELLTQQADLLRDTLARVLERQRQINLLTAEAESLDLEPSDRIHTVAVGQDPSEGALADVTERATSELMSIQPGGQFRPEVLANSLRRAQENLKAGVDLRVVHQITTLSHPSSVDYLTAIERLGGRVRLRENLPFRMLLIDRQAAVCAAPTGDSGTETYLMRGRRVMGLLDRIFETTWVDSTPLTALLDGRGHPVPTSVVGVLEQQYAELTAQQRTILRFLAEGETDQAIARQLGITPRTVTRRIAEIYRILGVDSRFQAGAVAQRLGLV